MMRIACMRAFSKGGRKLTFSVDYLTVAEEKENAYIVKNQEDGFEPRSVRISKGVDEYGHVSLNVPDVSCDELLGLSGVVYLLEGSEEKGKRLLKQTFLEKLQKKMDSLEMLKKRVIASDDRP